MAHAFNASIFFFIREMTSLQKTYFDEKFSHSQCNFTYYAYAIIIDYTAHDFLIYNTCKKEEKKVSNTSLLLDFRVE